MGLLRLFLALMVVFVHLGEGGDGRLAVQSFYMISGFYMSLVWSEKYAGQPNPKLTFYVSRALRIYPLYFIVLACSILLALLLWQSSSQFPVLNPIGSELNFATLLWVYLTQISLVGMETSIFYGLHGYWISPVAWSLGLELTFYLLVPILLSRPIVVLTVFATSLIARYVAYHQFNWEASQDYALIWSYRFFPFEIALFLAGVLAHQTMSKMSSKMIGLITSTRFFLFTIIVVIGSLGAVKLMRHFYWIESSYWFFYVVVFWGIIVFFLNTKNSRLDSQIGELSYPIYIVHLPVNWLLLYVLTVTKPSNQIYWVIPITLLLSFALSNVQTIIDRYRHSLTGIRKPVSVN